LAVLMNSIRLAINSARENHQDIDDLLRAARVVLKLIEARLTMALATGAAQEPGALRDASQEAKLLHDVCSVLGELSMGLAATGRDAIQRAADMIGQSTSSDADLLPFAQDCHDCLRELNEAVQVVQSLQNGMQRCRELLDDAVLRKETSPEVRAEVTALIGRLRGSLSR
jgi:hypothetical protein